MKVVNVYKPDVLKISTSSEKNLWSEMDWQNFQQRDSKQQLVVVSSEAMLLRPPYTSLKAILIYLSFSYLILSLFLCCSMINVNIIFMSVNRRYTEIAVIVYNAWGSV